MSLPSEAFESFGGISGDDAPLGMDAPARITQDIGEGILTGSLLSPAVRNPIC